MITVLSSVQLYCSSARKMLDPRGDRSLYMFSLWMLCLFFLVGCDEELPPVEKELEAVNLEQNWEPGWDVGQTQWYHHASQGTKIMKYSWFMALEQPGLGKKDLFSDPDYLSRFGFLKSTPFSQQNPDGLPIGFSVNDAFQEPFAKQPYTPVKRGEVYPFAKPPYKVVGLTCAACHTGQINYSGKAIRIEGGSAMLNLRAFQSQLGLAIGYTDKFPSRFKRFAKRVLGDDYADEAAVEALRAEFKAVFKAGLEAKRYSDTHGLVPVESGFSRTDALSLIGNRVFSQLGEENFDVANAPVNFPHVWDTSWFEWVQYNASIRLPMVRNVGEALGVGAIVNLDSKAGKPFKSTVDVKNLHLMEDQLGGDEPFSGLQSPKWPEDILGALDPVKIEHGRMLYNKHCVSCHLPSVNDILADLKNERPNFWTEPNEHGKQFLKLPLSDLQRIGTDPGQALNIYRRVVYAPTRGRTASAAQALYLVSGLIRNHTYRDLGLSEAEKAQWNRHRETGEDKPPAVKANLAYKARPLNGIWATPPYLHNSSVPNLYALLSPVAERPKKFYLGSKSFDPEKVGYEMTKSRGAFEFDTSIPGNLNTGHEFRDLTPEDGQGPFKKGVIGPALTEEEKWSLIEYLKSI